MTAGVRTYAPTSAELRAVARALGKRVGQGDWVPVESHQRGSPDDRLLQTMADPSDPSKTFSTASARRRYTSASAPTVGQCS